MYVNYTTIKRRKAKPTVDQALHVFRKSKKQVREVLEVKTFRKKGI